MSDRKPRPRTTGRDPPSEEAYHRSQEQHPPPHYYQPAPPPPPHMATYASYPPRQQFAPPPYPHYHGPPPHRGDPAASPPSEPFHPPLHRYQPRRNPITPESGQLVPAEFVSPPSNVKRRTLTPGSHSLTPSKRARTGTSSSLFRSFRHFRYLLVKGIIFPLSHPRIFGLHMCVYGNIVYVLRLLSYVLEIWSDGLL